MKESTELVLKIKKLESLKKGAENNVKRIRARIGTTVQSQEDLETWIKVTKDYQQEINLLKEKQHANN